MREQIIEANDFDLSNKDVQIHYSMESFISGAQLTYKTQNFDEQFKGEEIRVRETEIGKLVTVTVKTPLNPDVGGKVIKLTLLLPIVNLPVSLEKSIQVEAVLTTELQKGNINRPLGGQLQTYEIFSLRGIASRVDNYSLPPERLLFLYSIKINE